MSENEELKVIVVTRDMIKKPAAVPDFETPVPERNDRPYKKPLFLFGAAAAVLILWRSVEALRAAMATSFWSGAVALCVFGLICAAVALIAAKEKAAASSYEKGALCRETESATEARALLSDLRFGMPAEVSDAFIEWTRRAPTYTSARDVKDAYSSLVLEPFLDKKAAKIICSDSLQAAAFVATSPFALTDMLLVLASNLRMTARIAACYGVKPGLSVRLRIWKTVFRNMLASGGAELLTDAASSCGIGLLGKLSARTGQGLLTGLYAVRLGIKTAELCRPVVFNDKNKLSIKGLFPFVSKAFSEKKLIGDTEC